MRAPKLCASGRVVDLLNFGAEDVEIADLLAGMRQLRFGGQCSEPYTIGDHSYSLYRYAREAQYSLAVVKCCLTHDLAEAYLGDLHGPLKHSEGFSPFRILESRVQNAIEERLGLWFSPEDCAVTRVLDARILRRELSVLFPNCPDEYTHDPLLADVFVGAEEQFASALELLAGCA